MATTNSDQATFLQNKDLVSLAADNIEIADYDAVVDLDTEVDTLFSSLETAYPTREVRANFKLDLQIAIDALNEGLESASGLFSTLRKQWSVAVPEVDSIVNIITSGEPYDVYTQAPNVDGILQENGLYSPVRKSRQPFQATENPTQSAAIESTVKDNTLTPFGTTVISFNQYSSYKKVIRDELNVILKRVIDIDNYEMSITPAPDVKTRLDFEAKAQIAGFDKERGIFNYAYGFGYNELTDEEIVELNRYALEQSKILGYARVRKQLQFIIDYMFIHTRGILNFDLNSIYNQALVSAQNKSVREKLFGIAFTGVAENFLTVYGYTFDNLLNSESPTFVDNQFNTAGLDILNIFTKYKQELIGIGFYEANAIGGPELAYKTEQSAESLLYTTANFVPHTMYDSAGNAYAANTYEEHLRFAALGYTHSASSTTTTTTTTTTPTTTTTTTTPTTTPVSTPAATPTYTPPSY